jgi:pimeloyl-ACP methyl ester carboxylesterase
MKAAAAILAMALATSGATATAQELRDARQETLTAGDGAVFTVTSATVRVPERRGGAAANPAFIDLAVVRVRAGDRPSGATHVVLAGGPGDSGVNVVLGLARQGGAAIAGLMGGDIIGIDQRGTGKSVPSLASAALYGLPLDRPGSPGEWLPQIEAVTRRVAADFRARGIGLEHYNSRESADDIEDVRRAFGAGRLTVWGRSYGSHLALAFLARHPEAVERAVLVGPEGPDHTLKRPAFVDRVLATIAERAQMPDLVDRLRGVVAGLERQPAVVEIVHPLTRQPARVAIGGFDVQWLTSLALGDPRLLATLPASIRQMSEGHFTGVAQAAAIRRSRFGVESAMKHLMDLSSGSTSLRRTAIAREAISSPLGDAINFPGAATMAAWGAIDLGDGFRQPVRSEVPVLILAGDLDPRTPVENAREIAATLPRASVVVVENATHQFDLFGSAAMRELLGAFLRDGVAPVARIALPPIAFVR